MNPGEPNPSSWCDVCGKRPATNHITTIVEGVSSRRDLCSVCFESMGPPGIQELLTTAREAHCRYCGAPATVWGAGPRGLDSGVPERRSLCGRCADEYNRYLGAAMPAIDTKLPETELAAAMRQLYEDVEKHLREWAAQR
jgi:hypothetical protein